MEIEKNIPIPLYYRLAETLKAKILDSEFEIGETFPTEAELQEEYKVSRPTVRQALELLIKQGFLKRERGKTPYVAQRKLEHRVGTISSFTEDMIAKGLKPSTKILSLCYKNPPKIVAKYLKTAPNEKLVFLKRLRFVNDEPISISSSYIPKHLVPGLVEKGLSRESLYQTFEKDYGITLSETDETIQAVAAGKEEAELLNIPINSPVLLVHRIVKDDKGLTVEYNTAISRGDKFKYRTILRGRG